MMCICTFKSYYYQVPLPLPPLPTFSPDCTFLEPYSVVQMVAPAINQVRNVPVSFKSFCLIFTSNQGMDRSVENIDTNLENKISGVKA